jgi:MoxR-like ATPase
VRRKAPGAGPALGREVVAFVQRLRTLELFKNPGIAETIDWCNAIVALDRFSLDPDTIDDTLGALLKYQDDLGRLRGSEAARILDEVRAGSASI